MNPNRFVERMLNHMYNATNAAGNGNDKLARQEWQEVTDNLSDLQEWLEKGGSSPDLLFNYELFS